VLDEINSLHQIYNFLYRSTCDTKDSHFYVTQMILDLVTDRLQFVTKN
jgi:hypothetical protein